MSTDGNDGGCGTFWDTFDQSTGEAEGTPLERLLQSPDCSVEALLNEEDVIQEFKTQNERLITRLSQPDAAKALIEFITCDPPDGSTHERCYRYPFVASELMTCGADAFVKVNPELLDTFWAFMEVSPPAQVNPVLAGYFARTAAALLANHRVEVVAHLQQRGCDELLDQFLDRLHLRSIAELFARLLCAEQAQQSTFPVEGLIERLLSRLLDSISVSNDAQENVALITLELLSQKETLAFSDDLLKQLTSSKVVGLLIDGVFCGRPGSVVASAAILSSVVSHTYVAPKGGASTLATSTPTLSPLSSPSLLPPPLSGEDGVVNFGEDMSDSTANEAAPLRAASPNTSPRSRSRGDAPAALEGRGAALIRDVCTHIPRFRTLLDAALNPGTPTVLQMPVGAASAVGSTTLEVINLLTMLVRTGSPLVFEALLQDDLLPRCMELFFRHPWSSLLHNAVRGLLAEVLGGTDGQRPTLVLRLLQEGGLAERLAAEYQAEGEACPKGLRTRHSRVGYMGHLHAMCTELRSYGHQVTEVGSALAGAEGWAESVLPALEAIAKIHSEALGGGVPDDDRGLASSSAQTACTTSGHSAVRSNLESYDHEFCLNPLDEDMDDELQVLHLEDSLTSHAQPAALGVDRIGVGAGFEGFSLTASLSDEMRVYARIGADANRDDGPPLFPVMSPPANRGDAVEPPVDGRPADEPWSAHFPEPPAERDDMFRTLEPLEPLEPLGDIFMLPWGPAASSRPLDTLEPAAAAPPAEAWATFPPASPQQVDSNPFAAEPESLPVRADSNPFAALEPDSLLARADSNPFAAEPDSLPVQVAPTPFVVEPEQWPDVQPVQLLPPSHAAPPAPSAGPADDQNDRSWVADFDPFCPPSSPSTGPAAADTSDGGKQADFDPFCPPSSPSTGPAVASAGDGGKQADFDPFGPPSFPSTGPAVASAGDGGRQADFDPFGPPSSPSPGPATVSTSDGGAGGVTTLPAPWTESGTPAGQPVPWQADFSDQANPPPSC